MLNWSVRIQGNTVRYPSSSSTTAFFSGRPVLPKPRGIEESVWLATFVPVASLAPDLKQAAMMSFQRWIRLCVPSFDRLVMAPFKKGSKVRVLVRLRPERSEFKANERDNRSDMPDQCVRAVDSSTLELWNCRNSEESIRYRWERKTFWLYYFYLRWAYGLG